MNYSNEFIAIIITILIMLLFHSCFFFLVFFPCFFPCAFIHAIRILHTVGLKNSNQHKGRIEQRNGVGNQIALIPHSAAHFQESRGRRRAPQHRQDATEPPGRAQIGNVDQEDLDEGQDVDGQEAVAQNGRDGPHAHGTLRAHEIENDRHGQTTE